MALPDQSNDPITHRIFTEQVRLLYTQAPLSAIVSLLIAPLLALVLWQAIPRPALLVWLPARPCWSG